MGNIRLEKLGAHHELKIKELALLAKEIWKEHYESMLAEGQVEYMIEKFQSVDKIQSDIALYGYKYFIAYLDEETSGYCAIKADEAGKGVFLSKLYIKKSSRGHGISRVFLNEVMRIAKEEGHNYIWLTVNKNNCNSIEVYKKMGFYIIEELVADIGAGYTMDDYKMRLDI